MPVPVLVTEGGANTAIIEAALADSNEVDFFYATNRKPSASDDGRHYVTDFDQDLRLGSATVRIWDKGRTAEEVYLQAMMVKRDKELPLFLEQVSQQATVQPNYGLDLSIETRAYLDSINSALAQSKNKEIIVYVHGANNTFYRSSSQAAQFSYFTLKRSVVVLFSWPSAGSLTRYSTDVKNSAQSYEVFVRLINLLTRYTDARRINILSYSAGARIVSPGLDLLATQQQVSSDEPRKKLNLGIVYYASPDEEQTVFYNHLANYLDLADDVTVSVNFHDSVLAYAETYSGVARAGMSDPSQISEAEVKEIIKKLDRPNIHVIDVDGSKIPGLARGEHGSWYNHPWVNTDVILQFLYHASSPADRGLVLKDPGRYWKKYWIYPEDYPERIRELHPGIKARGSY